MSTQEKPLRAFCVSVAGDPEESEIVFATSHTQAKSKVGYLTGACDYTDLRVRRLPSFDDLAATGDRRLLTDEECFKRGCYVECACCYRQLSLRFHEEEVVFDGGQVFCREHTQEHTNA